MTVASALAPTPNPHPKMAIVSITRLSDTPTTATTSGVRVFWAPRSVPMPAMVTSRPGKPSTEIRR